VDQRDAALAVHQFKAANWCGSSKPRCEAPVAATSPATAPVTEGKAANNDRFREIRDAFGQRLRPFARPGGCDPCDHVPRRSCAIAAAFPPSIAARNRPSKRRCNCAIKSIRLPVTRRVWLKWAIRSACCTTGAIRPDLNLRGKGAPCGAFSFVRNNTVNMFYISIASKIYAKYLIHCSLFSDFSVEIGFR
jgi:hypothetical protein